MGKKKRVREIDKTYAELSMSGRIMWDFFNTFVNRKNKTYSCYHSLKTISECVGLMKKNVIKGIKELESKGIVFVERKKGESNVYYLLCNRSSIYAIRQLRKKPETSDPYDTPTSDPYDTTPVTPTTPNPSSYPNSFILSTNNLLKTYNNNVNKEQLLEDDFLNSKNEKEKKHYRTVLDKIESAIFKNKKWNQSEFKLDEEIIWKIAEYELPSISWAIEEKYEVTANVNSFPKFVLQALEEEKTCVKNMKNK